MDGGHRLEGEDLSAARTQPDRDSNWVIRLFCSLGGRQTCDKDSHDCMGPYFLNFEQPKAFGKKRSGWGVVGPGAKKLL
jgi:hypothetical protein